MQLVIVRDDLLGDEIAAFLEEHIRDMRAVSPPESKHALDIQGLRKPEVSFWSVRDADVLVGCGALKELDPLHAEVKSMRTSGAHRGKGVGAFVLNHLIAEAQGRGYVRLTLERGSMAFFEPARRLYARFGFERCGPFAGYREDPNSVFMTLVLQSATLP